MAITYSFTEERQDVWGGTRVWFGTVTIGGTTYDTGGTAVDTKATFGMNTIDRIETEGGSIAFRYNKGSGKVELYTFTTATTTQPSSTNNGAEALEEVDNAQNLASYGTMNLIVYGR